MNTIKTDMEPLEQDNHAAYLDRFAEHALERMNAEVRRQPMSARATVLCYAIAIAATLAMLAWR